MRLLTKPNLSGLVAGIFAMALLYCGDWLTMATARWPGTRQRQALMSYPR